MPKSTFVYATCIRTTPERLWSALTDADFMTRYWFGCRWRHRNRPELTAEGDSPCTMELEPAAPAVRLTITHAIARDPSRFIDAVSGAWPKIASNLKSLLESGSIALDEPHPAAASAA